MNSKILTLFKNRFVKLVRNHGGRIVITSHSNPDDDAISSVLSMYTYLTEHLNIEPKKVKIVISSTTQDRWDYFKYFYEIKFVKEIAKELIKTDLLILLDAKDWNRISHFPKKIERLGLKSICIDHHESKLKEGTSHTLILTYPKIKLGSNSETLFWTFFNEKRKLSKALCETLLLGIYGDSGSFTYIKGKKGTSSFLVAKKLINQSNVNIEKLKSKYQSIPIGGLKVLSILLSNMTSVKVKGWPQLVYSHISRTELNNFTQQELSEGTGIFKGYLTSIKNINWGFFVKYNKLSNNWSVSLRSVSGSVNVRRIAEYFGGGGHNEASGIELPTIESKKANFYINKVLRYLQTHESPSINNG